MLGDDPDPTVTTEWFGEVSDMVVKGGRCTVQRGVRWFDKRESKTQLVWNGQQRQSSPREGDEDKGRNGNDERMQILKNDGNEVPMQRG